MTLDGTEVGLETVDGEWCLSLAPPGAPAQTTRLMRAQQATLIGHLTDALTYGDPIAQRPDRLQLPTLVLLGDMDRDLDTIERYLNNLGVDQLLVLIGLASYLGKQAKDRLASG